VEKLLKTVAAALVAAAAAINKSPEVALPANNAAKAGAAFVQLLTSALASGAQPAAEAIDLKSLQELLKKLNKKETRVEMETEF
jgi:ABC-type glycerol-3-phosphate transport system substrate-binding protein